MEKATTNASKQDPKMSEQSIKIVSAACLGRSLLSSAKTCRKVDPLKPCQEGSRLHESTVFTFSLWPGKVAKMDAKSSQNGGPKLSKHSPERVSKKCSKNIIILASVWSQKGGQIGANIAKKCEP